MCTLKEKKQKHNTYQHFDTYHDIQMGKFDLYNYSPPAPPILAKTSTAPKPSHMVLGPIGNRFVDLCRNRFVDLCGNRFVDLCGNRFVGLTRLLGLRPRTGGLTKFLKDTCQETSIVRIF